MSVSVIFVANVYE